MQQFFKTGSQAWIPPPENKHNNDLTLVAKQKIRRQITSIQRHHTHGIRERSKKTR
jgi:hypothetical protein